MFGGFFGVPVPVVLTVQLVEKDQDVAPGQKSSSLLDYLLPVRPRLREGPHVEQVRPGEPLHCRELGAQIFRQPPHDPGTPPLRLLPPENGVANRPVQANQFRVHAALRAQTSNSYAFFQLGEDFGIILG